MFLTGIETNIPYLTCSGRKATIVTVGGAVVSTAMASILSLLVYWQLSTFGSLPAFSGALMVVFASTSAPLVIRIFTKLKLSNPEVGRLAISLISDVAAMILLVQTLCTRRPDRLRSRQCPLSRSDCDRACCRDLLPDLTSPSRPSNDPVAICLPELMSPSRPIPDPVTISADPVATLIRWKGREFHLTANTKCACETEDELYTQEDGNDQE
ncbi:hypothetical protein Taro_018746 [Colocasia esculenta]|uniref:Cation/H+ exchanger transmembrane domain-containing protein n=1 Tax=Colocasia esculenta TaxID=4460 RepID=A0A843UX52_COLES|nr:hypothetical protein [Colocasia esculenta]